MTPPEEPPVVDGGGGLAERIQAATGLVLGLDFDGTLAPIVADPDAATADPAVEEPLRTLRAIESVTVAVCSGRALADLAERVPVAGLRLVGNHGLEASRNGERQLAPAATDARPAVATVRDRLDDRLGDVTGCRIEDKGATVSVHVRETPASCVAPVRAAVERAVARHDDLRLCVGKAVFEVRPAADVDKGSAMQRIAADAPVEWLSLYVGDDTTDEDAFRAIQPAGVGVHVGDDPDTAAAHALASQDDVAPFLSWLATAVRADTEVARSARDDGG